MWGHPDDPPRCVARSTRLLIDLRSDRLKDPEHRSVDPGMQGNGGQDEASTFPYGSAIPWNNKYPTSGRRYEEPQESGVEEDLPRSEGALRGQG